MCSGKCFVKRMSDSGELKNVPCIGPCGGNIVFRVTSQTENKRYVKVCHNHARCDHCSCHAKDATLNITYTIKLSTFSKKVSIKCNECIKKKQLVIKTSIIACTSVLATLFGGALYVSSNRNNSIIAKFDDAAKKAEQDF